MSDLLGRIEGCQDFTRHCAENHDIKAYLALYSTTTATEALTKLSAQTAENRSRMRLCSWAWSRWRTAGEDTDKE